MGVDTNNVLIILHFLDCVDFGLNSLIGNVKIVNRKFFFKSGYNLCRIEKIATESRV